jgi:hypothetical protein
MDEHCCPNCNIIFSGDCYLDRYYHKCKKDKPKKYANIGTNNYKCLYCSKSYESKEYFYEHMRCCYEDMNIYNMYSVCVKKRNKFYKKIPKDVIKKIEVIGEEYCELNKKREKIKKKIYETIKNGLPNSAIPLGYEDLGDIKKDTWAELINCGDDVIIETIKYVHCNWRYPKFINICCTDKQKKEICYYDKKNGWKQSKSKNAIHRMLGMIIFEITKNVKKWEKELDSEKTNICLVHIDRIQYDGRKMTKLENDIYDVLFTNRYIMSKVLEEYC